jgi:uncharacterized protein YdaU (DUF1376 family)
MSDWYKMDPLDWNDGTDDLTLEQEAAYLRICHAIYIAERPIHDNGFVVAGLLRCNDRKAKRLLSELAAAGKITIQDGLISNRRAAEVVSERNRIRFERKSAGSRGGIESAKSRSKALKSNDRNEAIASTSIQPDKIRLEEKEEYIPPAQRLEPTAPRAEFDDLLEKLLVANGIADFRAERGLGLNVLAPVLAWVAGGLDLELDVLAGIRSKPKPDARTWGYFEGQVYEFAKKRRGATTIAMAKPAASTVDWAAAVMFFKQDGSWVHGWGPKPGEAGCRVPPEFLRELAA